MSQKVNRGDSQNSALLANAATCYASHNKPHCHVLHSSSNSLSLIGTIANQSESFNRDPSTTRAPTPNLPSLSPAQSWNN
jgi:hypothetical protein